MNKRQKVKNIKKNKKLDIIRKLISTSYSMIEDPDEKSYWLDQLIYMTKREVKKLTNTLISEKDACDKIDNFYDNPFPSNVRDIRDIMPDPDELYLVEKEESKILDDFFNKPYYSNEINIKHILPNQDKLWRIWYLKMSIQYFIFNSPLISETLISEYQEKLMDMKYDELVTLQENFIKEEKRNSPLSKYKK